MNERMNERVVREEEVYADGLRSVWRLWGSRGRGDNHRPTTTGHHLVGHPLSPRPPLAQRSRMEMLGFEMSKDPSWNPLTPY